MLFERQRAEQEKERRDKAGQKTKAEQKRDIDARKVSSVGRPLTASQPLTSDDLLGPAGKDQGRQTYQRLRSSAGQVQSRAARRIPIKKRVEVSGSFTLTPGNVLPSHSCALLFYAVCAFTSAPSYAINLLLLLTQKYFSSGQEENSVSSWTKVFHQCVKHSRQTERQCTQAVRSCHAEQRIQKYDGQFQSEPYLSRLILQSNEFRNMMVKYGSV
jgi:hypothetical protein